MNQKDDGSATNGTFYLAHLTKGYRAKLKQTIRDFRIWQKRRSEGEIVTQMLEIEGEQLRQELHAKLKLYRTAKVSKNFFSDENHVR